MDDAPQGDKAFEPLARLTTVGDLTAAHLLSARLESEGIHAIVRGEAMGPYPVTVGRMAVTEVWVSEFDLELAEAILEETDREAANVRIEPGGIGVSPSPGASALWWFVALALLAAVIYLRLVAAL